VPFDYQKKQSNRFICAEVMFVCYGSNLNLKIGQPRKLAVLVNKQTGQHKRTSRTVEGQYIWKIESLIDGKRRSITSNYVLNFFLVRCEIVQRGLESNLLCFSVRFVNKIKDMNLLNQERLLLQRPDNVLLTLR